MTRSKILGLAVLAAASAAAGALMVDCSHRHAEAAVPASGGDSAPTVQEWSTVDDSAPAVQESSTVDLKRLYDAIRQVETGGHPNPTTAIGDGGLSYGPFQIGRLYFQDAQAFDPSLAGVHYEQVSVDSVARRVMMAYWGRYAKFWTAEELSRLHNGGPSKRGTDRYWRRVSEALQR